MNGAPSQHRSVSGRPKDATAVTSQLFAASPDNETVRIARIVRIVGSGMLVAVSPPLINNFNARRWNSVLILGVELFLIATCLLINARGAPHVASRLLTFSAIALSASLQFVGRHGVHDVAILIYPGVIIVAGALFDRNWYIFFVSLSMGLYATQYTLELAGIVRYELSRHTQARLLLDAELILAVCSLGVWLLTKNMRESLAQLRVAVRTVGESEALYRSLFESVNEAIFVHDIRDGRIIDTNRRAVELSGYSHGELRRMTVGDLSANERGYGQSDALKWIRAAAAGQPQLFEWRSRAHDGRVFWSEVSIRSALVHGVQRVMVTLRDIDERKRAEAQKEQLEEQLRQAQKLESLGRLAGGVAHDFNNLLMCIMGNVELAASEAPGGHAIRQNLDEIGHAAKRAAELTNQLLAFSRKQPIAPRLIDLRGLLDSTRRMLQRLLGETITVRMVAADDLALVRADPGQVEQMLINLAANSRDAMPHGGTLTIVAQNVFNHEPLTVPGAYTGAFVRVSVTDTGLGMDPGVLEHVFEPFFTTKPVGKGTGLGLPMVFGAVQQNDGFIDVKSEPGYGTTFDLYFPMQPGASTDTVQKVESQSSPKGKERILLVEDQPEVRALTKRMIARLGYDVVDCADGDAATTTIQTLPAFDLLITDVMLPDIDCRTLVARILAIQPSLRVLYASGYSEDIIAHQGVVNQGCAFLAKPFTIDALARKIRETLEGPV